MSELASLQAMLRDALFADMANPDYGPLRLETPVWNPRRSLYQMGSTVTHVIDILPMIFNYRVALTPKTEFVGDEPPWGYEAAWCYPSLDAAAAAVRAWNFLAEPEPSGYTKRAI